MTVALSIFILPPSNPRSSFLALVSIALATPPVKSRTSCSSGLVGVLGAPYGRSRNKLGRCNYAMTRRERREAWLRAAGRGSGTRSSVRMESGHRHQVLHCLWLLAIALSLHIVDQSQSPLFVLQSLTRFRGRLIMCVTRSPLSATPGHMFLLFVNSFIVLDVNQNALLLVHSLLWEISLLCRFFLYKAFVVHLLRAIEPKRLMPCLCRFSTDLSPSSSHFFLVFILTNKKILIMNS